MAQARATEALAGVELWSGDHASRLRGIRLMEEAIARYRALGSREWKGWALAWLGYAAYYVSGDHERAAELMREGLEHFASTHRRVTVLTFLADVLCEQGAWSDFDAALDRATELCRATSPSGGTTSLGVGPRARAFGVTGSGPHGGSRRWRRRPTHGSTRAAAPASSPRPPSCCREWATSTGGCGSWNWRWLAPAA